MSTKFRARVIEKELLKDNIGILKFDADIDFIPGQFCNITLNVDGERLMRPFSMVSLPRKDYLEFYVKAHPDGSVAEHILDLEVGDGAELAGPYGGFNLRNNNRPAYFICAGSGVAPVMCMARHVVENSTRETLFLHGASHVDELGYMKELESFAKRGNFTYIPTVSRPEDNEAWEGRTGRVENLLDECTNANAEVYICGPPPMVQKVSIELTKKGFKHENLFTERYY